MPKLPRNRRQVDGHVKRGRQFVPPLTRWRVSSFRHFVVTRSRACCGSPMVCLTESAAFTSRVSSGSRTHQSVFSLFLT